MAAGSTKRTSKKTAVTLHSLGTSLPINTTSLAGSSWDMSNCYGGLLTIRIANGASAPTTGAVATVNVSVDGSTWLKMYSFTAGTTSSTNYDFVVEIPQATMYVQCVFSLGAATNGVTCGALGHELTAV